MQSGEIYEIYGTHELGELHPLRNTVVERTMMIQDFVGRGVRVAGLRGSKGNADFELTLLPFSL
jgi:hypothetical protein